MRKTAGAVIIGNEILSGKFADENAILLIKELRSLGVSLSNISIIPDDIDTIASTVVNFSNQFNIVFTSGGIGPTHDDVTIEAIAKGFDVDVIVHDEIRNLIQSRFGSNKMPTDTLRLAHVPMGAQLTGTAEGWPVIQFKNIYILPGVPSIFRSKFNSISSHLKSDPFLMTQIYCDIKEHNISSEIRQIAQNHPDVIIGSYPRIDETDYRTIVSIESSQSDAIESAVTSFKKSIGMHIVRITKNSNI